MVARHQLPATHQVKSSSDKSVFLNCFYVKIQLSLVTCMTFADYFINEGLRGHHRSRFQMNDKKFLFLKVCRSLPQDRNVCIFF